MALPRKDVFGGKPATIREISHAYALEYQECQKLRIQEQIPLPEPKWLPGKSEQPLQPAVLHPTGSLFEGPRQEGEGSSHGEKRTRNQFPKFVCPYFLSWAPQANEYNRGPRVFNFVYNI